MQACCLLSASVLLLTPAFAVAQQAAPSCGGVMTSWAGGSAESSDLSFTPFPIDLSEAISANDANGIAFALSASADVRLEAVAPSLEGDPVISLLDTDGRELGFDDDSGGGFNARLELSLDPGSYCLVVDAFGGADFNADIRLGRADHEAITIDARLEEDPTCTAETRALSLADEGVRGRVPDGGITLRVRADENPFMRFTLDQPQNLTFTAENQAADPVLRLYDDGGDEVAQNDDFNGLNARIDFEDGLEAGTYCISLTALSDPALPITVGIEPFDEDAFLTALYDKGDTAPPLDGSHPVKNIGIVQSFIQESVRIGSAAEWFVFEMPEDGLALISAISVTDGDPYIALYDEFGREIGFNDDAGSDLNSELPARIGRGRYLIALTEIGAEDRRNRTRLVIERYVPAR